MIVQRIPVIISQTTVPTMIIINCAAAFIEAQEHVGVSLELSRVARSSDLRNALVTASKWWLVAQLGVAIVQQHFLRHR